MRYLRLIALQVRASILLATAYRVEFLVQSFTALFWSFTALVPLWVVFGQQRGFASWSWAEALVVMGFFLLVKSLYEGLVAPSLLAVTEQIRTGTLDFVLLKPADAQFLVSTAKLLPHAVVPGLVSLGIIGWALHAAGRAPGLTGVAQALVLALAGVWVLYSLAIVVVSIAFRAVRVSNLIYLFSSVFDAARWPSSVFRGGWWFLFTFVVPLALMTTYPAEALLGRFTWGEVALSVGGASLAAIVARLVWKGSIRNYTSASS